MTEIETELTRPPERDPTMPAKKAPAVKKPRIVSPVPVLEPDSMNDLLLAIHEGVQRTDEIRAELEAQITYVDGLVREAVDEGERYRDIASAGGRTVPWVQMSLRRVAGVPTHPAAPIPDTRIRKARRKAS
jgi:hypothetical protein